MPPKKKTNESVVRAGPMTRSRTKTVVQTKTKVLLASPPKPTRAKSTKGPKSKNTRNVVAILSKTTGIPAATKVTTKTTKNDKVTKPAPKKIVKPGKGKAKVIENKFIGFHEHMLLRSIEDASKMCETWPDDEGLKTYLESEQARCAKHFPPMTAEAKKVKDLVDMKARGGLQEFHITNIDAVIRDYQNGTIKYHKDTGYYYYKGELILGPLSWWELMKKMETSVKIRALIKREGETLNFRRHAWFESFEDARNTNFVNWATVYTQDRFPNIIDYPIHVRKVRGPDLGDHGFLPIIRRIVLDDTGANAPTLSTGLDTLHLDIGVGANRSDHVLGGVPEPLVIKKVEYRGWLGLRSVSTANGACTQEAIILQVALGNGSSALAADEVDFSQTSEWRDATFLLLPGVDAGQDPDIRTGGPILRDTAWILSAPLQTESALVASNKDALFSNIPQYFETGAQPAAAVAEDHDMHDAIPIDPALVNLPVAPVAIMGPWAEKGAEGSGA